MSVEMNICRYIYRDIYFIGLHMYPVMLGLYIYTHFAGGPRPGPATYIAPHTFINASAECKTPMAMSTRHPKAQPAHPGPADRISRIDPSTQPRSRVTVRAIGSGHGRRQ